MPTGAPQAHEIMPRKPPLGVIARERDPSPVIARERRDRSNLTALRERSTDCFACSSQRHGVSDYFVPSVLAMTF